MSPPVCWKVAASRSTSASGGVVADEAPGDLGADELRRRRMARQQIEHRFAVLLAAAARDGRAEHGFGVVVVDAAAEAVVDAAVGRVARAVNRPAGEAARDFFHVGFGVAAVDARACAVPSARGRNSRWACRACFRRCRERAASPGCAPTRRAVGGSWSCAFGRITSRSSSTLRNSTISLPMYIVKVIREKLHHALVKLALRNRWRASATSRAAPR